MKIQSKWKHRANDKNDLIHCDAQLTVETAFFQALKIPQNKEK